MSELSDYIRCVSAPLEKSLRERIAQLSERIRELEAATPPPMTSTEEIRGLTPAELEQMLFEFYCARYVQRADARQKSMGLQYTEAETHDLAAITARFVGSLSPLPEGWVAVPRKVLEPFIHYAAMRDAKPIRGLGDGIHAIHTNTEWEAEITVSDCRRLASALPSREGLGSTRPGPQPGEAP